MRGRDSNFPVERALGEIWRIMLMCVSEGGGGGGGRKQRGLDVMRETTFSEKR